MPYQLPGPQVEPAASYWAGISALRVLDLETIDDLVVPRHPMSASALDREIDFLNILAQPANRVDPGLLDPVKLFQQATPSPSSADWRCGRSASSSPLR